MRLCVVGLGKLGAPLAAVLARAGHQVVGVDLSEAAVALLNAGRAPVDETGLQGVLDQCGTRLRATTDLTAAVRASEMSFVIVPTPSSADGTFALDHVLTAVCGIGGALRDQPENDHVVVVTSTVMPGSTGGAVRDALEAHAGRVIGDRLDLCYSPEFIALGSVIQDMTHPDLFLVGATQRGAGERLAAVLLSVAEGTPPVMHLNLVDAEVAKIAVNAFVTMKISYANMLAEICERIPGADATAVTGAIGLDSRIGAKYLRPGAAYGGPCFPRDNVALSALARTLGVSADIAEATDRVNRRQADRLAELVVAHLPVGERAAVLGLSYKPGTHVAEESAGVSLAVELARRGIPVTAHDPSALGAAAHLADHGVVLIQSLDDALRGAAVVVVTTPWPEYSGVTSLPGPRVVIDCWRCTGRAAAGVVVINPGASAAARTPASSAA